MGLHLMREDDTGYRQENIPYTKSAHMFKQMFLNNELPEGLFHSVYFSRRSFHSSVCRESDGMIAEDMEIRENWEFSYSLCFPRLPNTPLEKEFDRVIILVHGLNERSWEKYLPWAYQLATETKTPVILFPIAFHMNRSRSDWYDMRKMHRAAKVRREHLYTDVQLGKTLTCVNAAISDRLEEHPERCVFASVQTIGDIEQLAQRLFAGREEGFCSGTQMDFFAYSIGCTIVEALMMKDEHRHQAERLFKHSRAAMFCGGTTLQQADPVRRTILDDAVCKRLNKFFTRLLEGEEETLEKVQFNRYNELHQIDCLASLLQLSARESYREKWLAVCRNRILSIGITEDTVFSPKVMQQFWNAISPHGTDPVPLYSVHVKSTHEIPFPLFTDDANASQVDQAFTAIFHRVSAHYHTR